MNSFLMHTTGQLVIINITITFSTVLPSDVCMLVVTLNACARLVILELAVKGVYISKHLYRKKRDINRELNIQVENKIFRLPSPASLFKTQLAPVLKIFPCWKTAESGDSFLKC